MTAGSRERMRQLRHDRRALGLVEVSVWVPRDRNNELREMASIWCSIAIESAPALMALKRKQDEARRTNRAEEKYDPSLNQLTGLRLETPTECLPKGKADLHALAVSQARKVHDDALTKWQSQGNLHAVEIAVRTASDFLVARYQWRYEEADIEAALFAHSMEDVFGAPE